MFAILLIQLLTFLVESLHEFNFLFFYRAKSRLFCQDKPKIDVAVFYTKHGVIISQETLKMEVTFDTKLSGTQLKPCVLWYLFRFRHSCWQGRKERLVTTGDTGELADFQFSLKFCKIYYTVHKECLFPKEMLKMGIYDFWQLIKWNSIEIICAIIFIQFEIFLMRKHAWKTHFHRNVA